MHSHKKRSQAGASLQPHSSAVIYIRVSSKEQEETGFSLDSQLKFLHDYAHKQNIEVVHVYMDVESAKNSGRTEFGHLVTFLQTQMALSPGKSPCLAVLVEKTDRFYRNIHDLVTIRELGVTVHLVKENVVMCPTSKSHEVFVHGLNVLLAERMVNNLSEETQKGMLEKAQQGIWPSYAPIGYSNIEGPFKKRIIEVDPILAPLVRRMYEQYSTGLYSTKDLCKEAARIGLVHRKSGRKMTKSSLYDLLKNPIYYGDFYWKGILYNGTHEPIISKELFNKVQAMLSRRSSCPTGRQKHDFQFHGLLTCEFCGCAVVAELKKGRYVYYHCTGNKGKCPGKYVREEIVDQQFTQALKRIQIDDEVVGWIVSVLDKAASEDRKLREAQLEALSQQRQRLETRLEKMYFDKLDGNLAEDEYIRISNKFRGELTDIKFNIEKLLAENGKSIDCKSRVLELAQSAVQLYSAQIPDEKRKLLKLLCSNSTLACGEVTPNYRKPFDLIAVTQDEYERRKVTNPEKSDLFEIWRPRDDSNVRPLP